LVFRRFLFIFLHQNLTTFEDFISIHFEILFFTYHPSDPLNTLKFLLGGPPFRQLFKGTNGLRMFRRLASTMAKADIFKPERDLHLPEIVHASLPKTLTEGRRLLLVGDVHGCAL